MKTTIIVKQTIKETMKSKNITLKTLSLKTNINVIKLYYLLYIPNAKITLTYGLRIIKALGLKLGQLF